MKSLKRNEVLQNFIYKIVKLIFAFQKRVLLYQHKEIYSNYAKGIFYPSSHNKMDTGVGFLHACVRFLEYFLSKDDQQTHQHTCHCGKCRNLAMVHQDCLGQDLAKHHIQHSAAGKAEA